MNTIQVKPGDTVYLRGGTYYHPDRSDTSTGYQFGLQGSPEARITVQAYPGERAIIDGGLSSHATTHPRHLRIQDLEVIVSENFTQSRVSEQTGSHPMDLNRPGGGINVSRGHDIKLINNVIHANRQGISFWQNVSGNSELYGNVIYDNGWTGADRNHGHGIYTQNGGTHEDWKYIRNNILLDNWSYTAQAYGSSAAYVDRYEVSQNIYARGPHTQDGRFLLGGSRPSYLLRVYDNVSYQAALQVGYSFYSGVRADDVVVRGNRIWSKIEFGEMTHFTASDNFAWYDRYWAKPRLDGVEIDIPTSPSTFLYPNAYDVNRAHLAIQNFPKLAQVAVDMSGFLTVGDTFQLMDPMNFYGDPVYVGVYDGTSVQVPMAGENFAAFVVLRSRRNGENSAPLLTVPGPQSVNEDMSLSIRGIRVADVDVGTGSLKVTLSAGKGRLTLGQKTGLTFTRGSGTNDVSMIFAGKIADVNAALARVTYRGNLNANGADSLEISVDDQGNTGAGGAKSDRKAIEITVRPVNDAPSVNVPGAQTVTEDEVLTISGISVNDVDAGDGAVNVTLYAGHGELTLTQSTGLTFSLGDGVSDSFMVFAGALAMVNAALTRVFYLPDADYCGLDSLQMSVSDLGNTGYGGAKSVARSVGISVMPANDTPVLVTNRPLEVPAGGVAALTAEHLAVRDVDNPAPDVTFTLVTVPSLGALTNSGSALGVGGSFTQEDVDAGRISYVQHGGGALRDTWEFTVGDGAGGVVTQTTFVIVFPDSRFSIDVRGVGQALAVAVYSSEDRVPRALAVGSDGYDLYMKGNTWKRVSLILNITLRTVMEFDFQSGQQGEIHAIGFDTDDVLHSTDKFFQLYGTQNWFANQDFRVYEPSRGVQHFVIPIGEYFTGDYSRLVFIADDDVHAMAEQRFSNVRVYELAAVNEPPVLTVPGDQVVAEDAHLAISGINVADPDLGTIAMKVTLAVEQGRLSLGQSDGLTFIDGSGAHGMSTAFTGTLININAALATVSYVPTANFNGLDQLVIAVDDQGKTGAENGNVVSEAIAIRVLAVNDAPVMVVPRMQRTSFNTPIAIRGIGVSDVDTDGKSLEVRLWTAWGGTRSLARDTRLTFLQGDGTSDTSMLFRGTQDDLNAALASLEFSPKVGFTGYDVIQLSVNDLGNTGSGGPKTALRLINVKIDPIVHAP